MLALSVKKIMKTYYKKSIKIHEERQCDTCSWLLKKGSKAYKLYTDAEIPLLIVCPSCKRRFVVDEVTSTKEKVMEILDKNFNEANIKITVRRYNKILLDMGFTLDTKT